MLWPAITRGLHRAPDAIDLHRRRLAGQQHRHRIVGIARQTVTGVARLQPRRHVVVNEEDQHAQRTNDAGADA